MFYDNSDELEQIAELQAQLEAVTKDRHETWKLYKSWCDRAVTAEAAIEAVRRELTAAQQAAFTEGVRSGELQAALDAERIRREQVEMANYAKDGQIETLQAEKQRHDAAWLHHQRIVNAFQTELATLKRLVWALPYQTGNITKLNVEGLTILDAQPFVDLLTYRATLKVPS